MKDKQKIIEKIMLQVENGHIGKYDRDDFSQEFTVLQKGFIKHLLEHNLPEDNEGDVVERKKEKVIGRDSFWIDNCICGCALSENYTYCPICGKKIKRID